VDTASRLEHLEIKVAHLEHALAQLSDELARQQQVNDLQAERYRRLLERLEAAAPETPSSPFEIPPHY